MQNATWTVGKLWVRIISVRKNSIPISYFPRAGNLDVEKEKSKNGNKLKGYMETCNLMNQIINNDVHKLDSKTIRNTGN